MAMGDRALRIVPASERVDRVSFNPKAEWTEHVIHVGAYSCSQCETEFEFNTNTLERFELANGLQLGEEWKRRCEKIRPIGPWEWAVDFRCRGCKTAVRIIYGHDGEFAMGSYRYRLLEVLEERP